MLYYEVWVEYPCDKMEMSSGMAFDDLVRALEEVGKLNRNVKEHWQGDHKFYFIRRSDDDLWSIDGVNWSGGGWIDGAWLTRQQQEEGKKSHERELREDHSVGNGG